MPRTLSYPEQQVDERNGKYLWCNFARISNILSQMNVQNCKIKISISALNSHPSALRKVLYRLEIYYIGHDCSSSQASVSHAIDSDATRLTEKWKSWWQRTGYWKQDLPFARWFEVKKVVEEISIKRPFCVYIIFLVDEIHLLQQ